jgi:peptidoglycan/LPS O-acetylase OafA/YrhL
VSAELSIYLDLMRIVAATMVVVYHINGSAVTGRMLWRIADYGPDGVMIFFVLSGFVISYVAVHRERSPRAYFVARAARIYSVAVLAVPVTLLADAIGRAFMPSLYSGLSSYNPNTSWTDVASALTFTNELWSRHVFFGSDEPYWSLGFEVWYYVLFGVALFVRGWRGWVGVALTLLLGGPKIAMYFLIWLMGWAAYRRIEQARSEGRPVMNRALGAALFVLTPAAYALLHANIVAIADGPGSEFRLNYTTLLHYGYDLGVGLLFTLHVLGFAAIAPFAQRLTTRFGRPIRWCAGATFTLYLMHEPLMLCLASIAPWPAGSVARLLFVSIGIGVSVLVLAELGERRKRLWHDGISLLLPVRRPGVRPG